MNDDNALAEYERRLTRMERGLIGCLVLFLLLAGIVAHDHFVPDEKIRLSNPDRDEELVLRPDAIRFFSADANGSAIETVIAAGSLHHEQKTSDRTVKFVEVSLFEVDVVDYENQRRAVLSPATIGMQSGLESVPGVRPAWTALHDDGYSMTDTRGQPRLRLGRLDEHIDSHGLVLFRQDGEELWRTPELIPQ